MSLIANRFPLSSTTTEHAIQAFKKFDTKKGGTISPVDFADIMTSTKSHLLSEHVKQNLVAVTSAISENQVTFPYFMAFNTLLNNMELIKRIYLNFTKGNFAAEVTKEEFLYAAQQVGQTIFSKFILRFF